MLIRGNTILVAMCITICLLTRFWDYQTTSNLIFLMKSFFYKTNMSNKNLIIFRTKPFKVKQKAFFEDSVAKNCLKPELAPLSYHKTSSTSASISHRRKLFTSETIKSLSVWKHVFCDILTLCKCVYECHNLNDDIRTVRYVPKQKLLNWNDLSFTYSNSTYCPVVFVIDFEHNFACGILPVALWRETF